MKKVHTFVKSKWTGYFIRLGYVIRGILYGFIGLVAIQVGWGVDKEAVGTTGALSLIDQLYQGKYLLIVVAAGLVGYSMWGLIRGIMDFINPNSGKIGYLQRMGYFFSSISYALLIIPTVKFILKGPVYQQTHIISTFISSVIAIPYGNVLVFLVGVGSIGGGFYQIIRSIIAKNVEDFWGKTKDKEFTIPFLIFAKVGTSIRGLIFVFIGYFICLAGVATNASEVKEFDAVLEGFTQIPGGIIWLNIFGIGLICFGVYSMLLSLWVDLP